jgi:hypothetical protein
MIASSTPPPRGWLRAKGRFVRRNWTSCKNRLTWRAQQLHAANHSGSPEAETLAIEYEVIESTFKDLLTTSSKC